MKLFVLILLLSTSAFARWATRGELPYVVLNDESEVVVKKDGTYTVTQIMEFEVQNDGAKERFSLFPIPFNSSMNKLTILEAKVTNGSSVHPYDKTKVAERSQSKENAISDVKIMQIPLSNIQVGSKIFIKFKMDYNTAIVPGHFSMTFNIGEFNQADNASIKIESEIPLSVVDNDPFNVINVREKKNGVLFSYHAFLTEPYLKLPVQEGGSLTKDKFTFIKISSDKDWNKITNDMRTRFEKVLSQPVPKDYVSLIQEMQKIGSLEDKVNNLLAYMTQKYNYLGDWRTVSGGFTPRSLEEIASTKFGDCKDFSVMTVKLLREMKINADIALVMRGPGPIIRMMSYETPSMDLFNHAIVRIEDKGKVFWVDPTNKLSFGLNQRLDISGRPALPLIAKVGLENIPLNPDEKTFINVNKNINYESETTGQVSGDMTFSGTYGLVFRELAQDKDQSKVEKSFLSFFNDGEEAIVPDVSGGNLDSKLYSKINLKLNYSASELAKEDGDYHLGVLPGPVPLMKILAQNVENWEGDLYIGEEQEFNRTVKIKGIFAARRPHGCDISTDWVDYKRSFEFLPDGLRMKEKLSFKKEVIPQNKFKSTDFELLQSNLFSCVSERDVKFKWTDKKHAETEEEVDKRFAKLPLKERIEKRIAFVREAREDKTDSGFSDMDLIYFLKKNVQEDPSHYVSYRIWSNIVLMDGYFNGNNFNQANVIQAQKVITEGLHNIPNNINLLIEYQKLRMYETNTEAESVYREAERLSKKEEITDVHTFVSLAKIFEDLGDAKSAFPFLAKALKMAKNDYEKETVWFRLANSYSAAKEYEKCIGAYKQVFKINPKDAFSHINVISCYVKAKKFDEAVTQAKAGLKITNSGMMKLWVAEAYSYRASDKMKKNNLTEAEKDFKDSLQYRRQSYPYSGLAWIAIQRRDFDKAVALINEGLQYHEGDKTRYVNDNAIYLAKLSPEHFKKLTGKAIDESLSVADKLWGFYNIGHTLHKEKKREELYTTLEKGIAIGEQVVTSGKIHGDVALALGALYGLYGTDSDNEALLNKAVMLLSMAKSLGHDVSKADKHLNDVNRILDNIKNGRIPASELNFNRRYKNLKYGMGNELGNGRVIILK